MLRATQTVRPGLVGSWVGTKRRIRQTTTATEWVSVAVRCRLIDSAKGTGITNPRNITPYAPERGSGGS